MSYIHHTNDFRKCSHVGNTAQHCRLGLFQDSDFAGDLEDSKSTQGRILYIFGSRTFISISWMCNKQTSVSHSSTESEIIADLPMDGIPALDLWWKKCYIHPKTCGTMSITSGWRRKVTEKLMNCQMWITLSQARVLLKVKRICTFSRTLKQWSRWSLKEEIRWWVTCLEPTKSR